MIKNITEYTGLADAGINAGRFNTLAGTVLTEIALIRSTGYRVKEMRPIRTGLYAILATNTDIRIDDYNAVFITLPRRPGGTYTDAWWFRALVAKSGKK